MMTCIERLKLVGTAPKHTMTKLCAGVNPIRGFFKSVSAIRRVHSNPPQLLLGGDLSALINQQLGQALAQTATKAASTGEIQHRRMSITSPSPIDQETVLRPETVTTLHKTQQAWPISTLELPGDSEFDTKTETDNTTTLSDGQLGVPDHPEVDRSHFGDNNDKQYKKIDVIPDQNWGEKDHSHHNSLLSKVTLDSMLRRYWILNADPKEAKQAEISGDKRSSELASDAHPQTYPTDVKPSAVFWPDQVGQVVTATIQESEGKDQAAEKSYWISNKSTGLTINNSFKIDLANRQNGNHYSESDLSQRIADILRYQALQHGIDIT